MPLESYSKVYNFFRGNNFRRSLCTLQSNTAALEVEVEKVTTVEAVLELSVDELRQQLDLYCIDTKSLVGKPQLQKALIKVITPASPVSKTKEEWLLKSKQIDGC